MITAVAIGALIFALIFYQQARVLQAQIAELRRVMDYQFDGLRYEFKQVNEVLKFVEPQIANSILGYVAVRHTGLGSINEIKTAVESGKYNSALIPLVEIRTAPPKDSQGSER